MPGHIGIWLSFGILWPLLLAVGAIECSEKETLINPLPRRVIQPSDCLMECTGMTYIKKLQLQDNHNIRLSDSTEGKETQHDTINSGLEVCGVFVAKSNLRLCSENNS